MTNTSPLLTQGWALHCNPGHAADPSSIFFDACPLGAFCWMGLFMLTGLPSLLKGGGLLSSPQGQGPPRAEMTGRDD